MGAGSRAGHSGVTHATCSPQQPQPQPCSCTGSQFHPTGWNGCWPGILDLQLVPAGAAWFPGGMGSLSVPAVWDPSWASMHEGGAGLFPRLSRATEPRTGDLTCLCPEFAVTRDKGGLGHTAGDEMKWSGHVGASQAWGLQPPTEALDSERDLNVPGPQGGGRVCLQRPWGASLTCPPSSPALRKP